MGKREALEFLVSASIGAWDMIHDSLFLTTQDCDKIFAIRRRINEARDVLAVGIVEPEQLTLNLEVK